MRKKPQLSELPLNPFEDNVVFEPREAERSVRGLNDQPLERLQKQFARLEMGDYPRTRPAFLKAQLVTSAEPGYGKSHLIGRLFKAVNKRATVIYIRPFQDASASWRSILLRVVQELHRPDAAIALSGGAEGPTQLDVFAHGVIGRLLSSLIKQRRVALHGGDSATVAKKLSAQPLRAFDSPGGWLADFSEEDFARVLPLCAAEMQGSGLTFHAPPEAWLKVLFTCARSQPHSEQRAICAEWLKGEILPEEDAKHIGLTRPDLSASAADETAAQRNERALGRVQDFCALAGFYRPFLFCFDQTELFTSDPLLMIEFGAVVDRLVSHGLNLMAVVTANLEPWTRLIKKNLQTALHDRFSDPIELEGMNELQAGALARQRLERWNLDEREIERFCDPVWLARTFEEKKTCSVREFLRRCARRCDEMGDHRPDVKPEQTLKDFLQHFERELNAKSPQLEFDPDILRWAISPELVRGAVEDFQPEKFVEAKRYFSIRWENAKREIYFGFEDSAHWKRWEAIVRHVSVQSKIFTAQNKPARFVFLRTPEQPPVPNPKWKMLSSQFEEAANFLRIHVLAPPRMRQLYAAYELYANVVEGNAPFSREETLRFIREQLHPWWMELVSDANSKLETPPAASSEPSPALIAEVRKIVKQQASINLDSLAENLAEKSSSELILAACQRIPEIKVFATSHATALKWNAE